MVEGVDWCGGGRLPGSANPTGASGSLLETPRNRPSAQSRPSPSSVRTPASGYPLLGHGPPSSSEPASNSIPSLPRTERDAACREIGLWLVRALAGDHRGSSGRDRLPQGSRLWLVLRDHEGNTLRPPRVYTALPAKAITKRGSDLGASVLVGLPSRADLQAVLAAAQLGEPSYH